MLLLPRRRTKVHASASSSFASESLSLVAACSLLLVARSHILNTLPPKTQHKVYFFGQQKILLGTCHVIYVRLTSIHYRTHDRHGSTLQAKKSPRSEKLLPKERPVTMTTRLQNQACQSGLVLSDDKAEWNENGWPPLEGGWRSFHASVVLNHPVANSRGDGRISTRSRRARFRSCIKFSRSKQALARRTTHEQESSRTCRCCVQRKRLRDGRIL